jgi:hypothetical protein
VRAASERFATITLPEEIGLEDPLAIEADGDGGRERGRDRRHHVAGRAHQRRSRSTNQLFASKRLLLVEGIAGPISPEAEHLLMIGLLVLQPQRQRLTQGLSAGDPSLTTMRIESLAVHLGQVDDRAHDDDT